jgi:hypothetical protein
VQPFCSFNPPGEGRTNDRFSAADKAEVNRRRYRGKTFLPPRQNEGI